MEMAFQERATMNKDEALRMAIEWLEGGAGWCANKEVIQACKEALEQPAQEPVAWMNDIAYSDEIDNLPANRGEIIPLYTHPAPLWQRLSDDEIEAIDDVTLGDYYKKQDAIDFARAIEAKLKEKNHA